MKTNNIFMMLAVAALVLSAINASLVLIKTPSFEKITGYASSGAGYVNITLNTQITINMTTDTINWGAGTITSGQLNASLNTNSGNTTGYILRGNWTAAGHPGLVVANIGNINATLTLATAKNAADLFGGTAAQQAYQWNVTNKDPGSCIGGAETLGVWSDVNKTTPGIFCSKFNFLTDSNEVYIDIKLVVPYDATGVELHSDTITVTASPAT